MYAAGLSESRPALDYLSLRRTFSAGHLSVGVLAPGAPRLHTGFELGEQEHHIHGFVELVPLFGSAALPHGVRAAADREALTASV